ncbi:hypothetical protein C8R48DRAFT_674914 [Suillus tomentosus]|nr:hypothetical protein C8R48DRAFT_674914 [Suillus tomentosus]
MTLESQVISCYNTNFFAYIDMGSMSSIVASTSLYRLSKTIQICLKWHVPTGLDMKSDGIRMGNGHQLGAVVVEVFLQKAAMVFFAFVFEPDFFSIANDGGHRDPGRQAPHRESLWTLRELGMAAIIVRELLEVMYKVFLKEFQARPKNTIKDRIWAQEVMDKMKAWENELGNTLVAYFTRRAQGNVEDCRPHRQWDDLQHVWTMPREREKLYFDGIKRQTLEKVIVSTQLLILHLGIQHAICDGHHDGGDILMKYAKDSIPPGETLCETNESTGVLNLVHEWAEQGHAAGTMVVNPSPFRGRVIVWKLAVLPHQDGLDAAPAVIFSMGCFEGGEYYVPDLKLKLSYWPGEVIILMASVLYNGIGDWTF